MTLLETVVALVILSLAAVGSLELFQGSARSAADAKAWVNAVAYAEEGVEAAKIGPAALDRLQARSLADGFSRHVRRVPAAPGIEDIVVTIILPGGRSYVLHRLVTAR